MKPLWWRWRPKYGTTGKGLQSCLSRYNEIYNDFDKKLTDFFERTGGSQRVEKVKIILFKKTKVLVQLDTALTKKIIK